MLNYPRTSNPSADHPNSTRNTNHELCGLVLRTCLIGKRVSRWIEWAPSASLARRFRLAAHSQKRTSNTRNAEHHQDASDEIHRSTSVGLTRIELVTSSLSGMRSNQLSYSPESDSGTQILLALTVTLNRAHNNLFLQHSHANTTHKIGNEVENGGSEDPEGRRKHHT